MMKTIMKENGFWSVLELSLIVQNVKKGCN